jgi:probable addiction module antidote protein
MNQTLSNAPTVVGHPVTHEQWAAHLQSCIRENDPGLLAGTLGRIARERGVTQLSRDTGIRRTTLYRILTLESDPSFSDVLKVARALGFSLSFTANAEVNITSASS